jgi:hypothetical protein
MGEFDDMFSPPELLEKHTIVERTSLGVIGLMALLVLALAGVVLDLRSQVQDNREEVFRGRAVDCRIQKHLSIPLADNCLAPEVTKYYDPAEMVARTQGATDNLSVNCAILRIHGLDSPVCAGI